MRKSRHFLKLSLCQRYVAALVASLPLCFCVVDYFNGWHFLGHSGKALSIFSAMIVYFAATTIAPTESEMKALDRKKSAKAIADLTKKLSE